MLLLAKFIAKILSILNGEVSPRQIAAGVAYGVILGLVPAKGLMPIALLLFGFIININLPMMTVSAAIFKLLSYLIDPAANLIGFQFLVKSAGLKAFWTALTNMPVVPFTRFNNTIVLGSLVLGIAAFLPLYILANWGVVLYRTRLRDRVLKLKIIQLAKASQLYKFYLSFRGITGG